MIYILLYLLLAAVSTGVLWWGSDRMEQASEHLSRYFELPGVVQGAVVVALGSSFPEFSTVLVSTLYHHSFELGVSAIVGSAIFNILFIPALSSFSASDRMGSSRSLVYKEAQFYIISVAALLLMFCLAVIYYPVDEPGVIIRGEITRILALIPVLLYGLYVFVQYKDTMDHTEPGGPEPSSVNPGLQCWYLVISLVVILIGVEGLIRSALAFGHHFDAPSWLWGVTIIAAGTSIPDLFISIRAAQQDRALTSMANVFGSNIFDLLICIPTGVLVAGPSEINFTIAAPLMGILIFATVVLFTFLRTNMTLSSSESWILLLIYLIFVLWMSLESFGVFNLIRGLPPAS